MRWRTFLVVLLICSFIPLFAKTYRSNSLGMELELLAEDAELANYEYIIISESNAQGESTKRLYQSGQLVKEIQQMFQSHSPERLVVLETDYEADQVIRTSRTLYIEGLPSTHYQQTPTDSALSWYNWQEQQLASIRTLVNQQILSNYFYLHSSDGALAAVLYRENEHGHSIFYFPSSDEMTLISATAQDITHLYSLVPAGTIITLETEEDAFSVSIDSVGHYQVEQRDGGVRVANTYQDDGLLLKQTILEGAKIGVESLYHYDEHGYVSLIVENYPFPLSSSIKRWYDEGYEMRREEYQDGELQKRSVTHNDGTYRVTLFVEGKAYVDLLYEEEGGKVVEISYY